MRIALIAALAALPLAACDNQSEPAPEPTAAEPTATATEALTPTPTPEADDIADATAIPTAIRGRWGLVEADCEPGRDDAKGLLTISANELDFYESVGTLDDVKELGETRIRADFDFVGEGQEWERDVTLEAREGGTVLIRREDGVDAAPGEFRYTKCA